MEIEEQQHMQQHTPPPPQHNNTMASNADMLEEAARLRQHLSTFVLPAAQKGDVKAIRDLAMKGAKLNGYCSSEEVYSPLASACSSGHLELVIELLWLGADPNYVPGLSATSPLVASVEGGYVEIVAALLKAGADVTARSPKGKSLSDCVPEKLPMQTSLRLRDLLLKAIERRHQFYLQLINQISLRGPEEQQEQQHNEQQQQQQHQFSQQQQQQHQQFNSSHSSSSSSSMKHNFMAEQAAWSGVEAMDEPMTDYGQLGQLD